MKTKTEKSDFITIPGFSNYEINSNNIVRNKLTEAVINGQKALGGKFQLANNEGSRKAISLSDILAKLPKRTNHKNDIEEEGKESKREIIIRLNKEGKTNKEIVEATGFKSGTVFEAINTFNIVSRFKKGATATDIALALGKKKESIVSFIERNNLKR